MAIAQRDPLVEYKRDSFMMFNEMREQISMTAIQYIFRVQLPQVSAQPVRRQMQLHRPDVNGNVATSKPEPVRANKRPRPNELCWCGSGKKYKKCHYRLDKEAEAAQG